MPSVFLSHSRANLQRIEQIENGLKEANVSVWRDQEQLYGGEKWPKRLGEAIAAQEFFLLAWSENAQKSFFVELEWCTALALKKDIIICLLDDTPIPESLRSYHSITAKDAVHGVPGILKAVRKPMREKEPDRTNQVIDQLDQIPSEPPEEVLKSAKAIFQQHHWTFQGPVYQAGGGHYFSSAAWEMAGLGGDSRDPCRRLGHHSNH